jgi:hypothetical protein
MHARMFLVTPPKAASRHQWMPTPWFAHANFFTPAFFAAFCKSSSSVASGRPARKASSRYEASYAESWYRLAS